MKECAEQVADTYVLLFNASLKQKTIPDDWKHALVTPIHKGNNKSKSQAENYRPVSLTSITCKLLEHVIHSHVINHLEEQQILTDSQHGFRKKRSCETQLLITVNQFAKSLNNSEQVDAILLDFSKAFDKVCHRKLLMKLEHYGVNGNILGWIEDFLHGRTQNVVVRGTNSEESPVTSGVPQGTVLGPLLFLVYINDMPLSVESSLPLFADDSLLHKIIKSILDTHALQRDLDRLVVWENDWSMEFHPDKCKLLRITNKRKPVEASYTIHNTPLEKVDHAKYLGVTITKNLNWKKHINNIIAKATNTRLYLQRNLQSFERETKLLCYKVFIRPIVEYACSIWSPNGTQSLVDSLEMIQRKAVRWIENKWKHEFSPTRMLKSLNLRTLEMRRQIASLKLMFDIYYNLKFVDNDTKPDRQRCSNIKFKKQHARLKVFEGSYFPFTINLWNSLPPKISNIQKRENFVLKLEEHFNT